MAAARPLILRPLAAWAATGLAVCGVGAGPSSAAPPAGSGGAPIVGARHHHHGPARLAHGRWLGGVTVTEYWPAPEAWFSGALVRAPGLPGRHRIDWLYSAAGVSMQGSGVGLDGRAYHLASAGHGGWVTRAGRHTSATDDFAAGAPYWRAGDFWRGPGGRVTFPLAAGGWSAGRGRRHVALPGVSFAPGPGRRLVTGSSLAVDPSVIALGSRVYIPAYRGDRHGGWFVARDTGGAIHGRHVDVYRRPPSDRTDPGARLAGQRIYVVAPRPSRPSVRR